ncbi:glycosyltransferase [Roseovarius amoyensis]|uniref:glycosyltransferase n=1 Tax=Roseovarius amoyensis TaxID=2211448 RepID=UPI000DBE95ED|nr:glycosyltransferase [Roseovarius amoyensis]
MPATPNDSRPKAGPPPHLALLLPHLRLGGVEKSLCTLAAPLQARGWRVSVVVQAREGALLDSVSSDIALHDLGGRRLPGASWALARLMRREGFDMVYSATNATNIISLLARRLAWRDAITACAISEHTPLEPFLAVAKWPWPRLAAIRLFYPRAQALCAPMPEIGAEHDARLPGILPPFHVLPNAVVGEIPPWPPLADTATRLVSIGRLSREKRFDLTIHAFARLHAQHPDARLTIHGDGPERDALQSLVRELNLDGAATLPGQTRDVAGVLAQADGFLCTSLREGLGNAIIEAQAAGVPVLSVDCPFGPRHLLRDGRAGLLLQNDDLQSLGEALIRFSHDKPAREAWREAARDVATGYTVDAAADSHDRLFRAILAEHRQERRNGDQTPYRG